MSAIENDAQYTATGQFAYMWDSAYCPDPVPPGFNACMVYAGGSSYSGRYTGVRPDGWNAADLALVHHLPKLICWVPTPGYENPRQSAMAFVDWLRRHDVPSAHDNHGKYIRVMWDLERGVEPDPGWVNIACGYVLSAGYFNLIYGSESWTFAGQPSRAGYVIADPTGTPHMVQHPHVVGTQYAWNVRTPGGTIDITMFDSGLLPVLWHTP